MMGVDPVSLRRPDEAVALTDDGLLHVLTLREGEGVVPPKHSRCLVHYVGRLADSGEMFMDTRSESQTEEPAVVIAGRDAAIQETGLALAVARMRSGERCRVWAAPKYGYGERGSFSFPTVPPSAHLVYDIELLDFEPPNEEKDRAMMTFEERLEAAERRRADGNAAFQAGAAGEALKKYRLALSYMNEDLLMQLGEFHFQKAMEVKRPVQLNIAACQLRQEDYDGAIVTCCEVLGEEPKNAKALFRRGRARHALGQLDAARADLEAARAAAPGDAGIVRELAAVKSALKEERAAGSKLFKGYFEKNSERLYEEEEDALADSAAAGPDADDGQERPGSDGQQQRQRQQWFVLLRLLFWGAAAVGFVALLLPVLREYLPGYF